LYNDLAVATSALTETVDPDAVAIPATTTVAVTLNEYGNSIISTRKLDLFSLADVEPALANIVAYNMNDSLDTIVRGVLATSTQVIREIAGAISTAAVTGVSATDTIKAKDIRYTVAKMRAANVVPRRGSLFASYIHPEVSHDLRAETGAGAWRDTFIMGQQALAEAVAEEPHTVIGPVTDKLMRLRPIGWYGVLGWNLYRPEAMWRVQTASSVRPAA